VHTLVCDRVVELDDHPKLDQQEVDARKATAR
jgi:hypothetical protein